MPLELSAMTPEQRAEFARLAALRIAVTGGYETPTQAEDKLLRRLVGLPWTGTHWCSPDGKAHCGACIAGARTVPIRALANTDRRVLAQWGATAWMALWIIWDVIASNDPDSWHTWPLTYVIRTYVPVWVYFPAAIAVGAWLVWHFWPPAWRH